MPLHFAQLCVSRRSRAHLRSCACARCPSCDTRRGKLLRVVKHAATHAALFRSQPTCYPAVPLCDVSAPALGRQATWRRPSSGASRAVLGRRSAVHRVPTKDLTHLGGSNSFSYALRPAPTVNYRREVLPMADGGRVTLDWAPAEGLPATAPVVLLAHGLAGASDENYIRSFCARATSSSEQRAWRVVVFNRRGHGDTVHVLPSLTIAEAAEAEGRSTPRAGSSGQLSRQGSQADGLCAGCSRSDNAASHAKRTWPRHGDTSDMHAVADHIAALFPDSPLLAVGYSAGSNILVKYLAEAGSDAPFVGAISVSNAYDLVRGTTLFAKHHPLWDWYMARSLRNLAARHWDMLEQVIRLPKGLVRKASSVRDLDTLVATPLYGYPSVDAYYADQHCCALLSHVTAPTLLLNARDDPIIHPSLLDYPINACATNPALISAITQRGGHLGWLEGWWPHSWYEVVLFEFCEALLSARQTGIGAAEGGEAGTEGGHDVGVVRAGRRGWPGRCDGAQPAPLSLWPPRGSGRAGVRRGGASAGSASPQRRRSGRRVVR